MSLVDLRKKFMASNACFGESRAKKSWLEVRPSLERACRFLKEGRVEVHHSVRTDGEVMTRVRIKIDSGLSNNGDCAVADDALEGDLESRLIKLCNAVMNASDPARFTRSYHTVSAGDLRAAMSEELHRVDEEARRQSLPVPESVLDRARKNREEYLSGQRYKAFLSFQAAVKAALDLLEPSDMHRIVDEGVILRTLES